MIFYRNLFYFLVKKNSKMEVLMQEYKKMQSRQLNNINEQSLISNSSLNISKVFNQDLSHSDDENLGWFYVIPGSK